MMDKNIPEYKTCLYYCYGQFCNKWYKKETFKYGYSDLTEYRCYRKCPHFRKNNWWNRLLRTIFG